jgi:hypothetical protein
VKTLKKKNNFNDNDVNQLFTKSFINEIGSMNQDIENEIEEKKEELRTMVTSIILFSLPNIQYSIFSF